jgi:hypothetical protein
MAGVAQSVEQLICNQPVAGSSPIASSREGFGFQMPAVNRGLNWELKADYCSGERFPSGQREQTVNLSAIAFGGSNPPLSTTESFGRSATNGSSSGQQISGGSSSAG